MSETNAPVTTPPDPVDREAGEYAMPPRAVLPSPSPAPAAPDPALAAGTLSTATETPPTPTEAPPLSDEEPLPDDATDFDPAVLEAAEPETPSASGTAVPPPPPTTGETEATPSAESPSPDLFDNDPFFNPDAPSAAPAAPPRASTLSDSGPTAEERLLNTIVGEPRPEVREETKDPAAPPLARAGEALALEHALEELAQAKDRCQTLEAHLAAAVERATREASQRRDEAVRHTASEQEWSRKAEEFKRQAHRLDLHRDFEPQRPSSMLFTGVIIAGVVVAVAAFVAGYVLRGRTQNVETATVTPPTTTSTPAPERDMPPEPRAVPAPPEPGPASVSAPSAPAIEGVTAWPVLTGSGFTARRQGAEMTVVFNYGVFTKGAELSEPARQDLTRIAAALKPVAAGFRLEVTGHTDAAPIAAGRPFASNMELGLSRAKAAADYLTRQCGLPTGSIATSSAGDSNPPYPNTTAESRRKNRTVVLHLRPL